MGDLIGEKAHEGLSWLLCFWLRFWLRFGHGFGDDQEYVAVTHDPSKNQEMSHDFKRIVSIDLTQASLVAIV